MAKSKFYTDKPKSCSTISVHGKPPPIFFRARRSCHPPLLRGTCCCSGLSKVESSTLLLYLGLNLSEVKDAAR
ncbi:hypothetical protein LWI29_013978 [Acer saccharum]|uniref:Uncharacterized protein n=1 Tax=Acer saccharum TaxID=4024 RepID=A0AA39T4T0_ACESA|nr:hypothetical protein LWI29_013978 [Acer saccharum]